MANCSSFIIQASEGGKESDLEKIACGLIIPQKLEISEKNLIEWLPLSNPLRLRTFSFLEINSTINVCPIIVPHENKLLPNEL